MVLEVAQLALKHRQNKKQKQRIIVFAGSPVNHDKKQLEMIRRKLKKNSVALDIVDFGEETDHKPKKLEALLAAADDPDLLVFALQLSVQDSPQDSSG